MELTKEQGVTIVDVREKDELPNITRLVHQRIPMSVFKEEMGGINGAKIVFICQQGARSLHAARLFVEMRGVDKDVYSLKGGVVASGGLLE
jgi:adenylyltransferase/sulfurtransferase